MIFGAIIGAGIIGMLIAPIVSRMLKFFPPVVTGTIILVIGVTLMRIGVQWIFGVPVGPTAPKLVSPDALAWMDAVKALPAGTLPELPQGFAPSATVPNPAYASPMNMAISGFVLVTILLVLKFAKGFISNIAVLTGIFAGAILALFMGMMHMDKVAAAKWFAFIPPFHFGMPIFDPIMILTFVMVMIVVMIESTGMFLALGDICQRKITQKELSAGLRTDGLGTMIGGIFNTFPYTSFSQNVGLVGVTGIRSRFVCVVAGAIMIVLGLLPKVGSFVEALPVAVLGGAGLVMFGMVAATGVRILSRVNFSSNRFNLFIVAISLGFGMIPLIAPDFAMWLPHSIRPLIDSGILLASISSVLLNLYFNGTDDDAFEEIKEAAKAVEGGH